MLSKSEQNIVEGVEEYGWFALSVAPRGDSDDPEEWFTYTIGLPNTHGWPEIICFGLASDTAHGLLTDAIAECEQKEMAPSIGLELAEVAKGYKVLIGDASAIHDHYFGSAIWYARWAGTQAPPPRVQLLWPDKAGRFPADPACSPEVRRMQTPLEVAE
jgi:hypothetical protein